MRPRALLLLPLLVLLVAAPAAHAGGFATVGLSSTPAGVAPGQPWTVDITVLAHGRTPVAGLPPVVHIRSGDTVRGFRAVETDKPGVYRAEVVFPRAGTWSYEVVDGYIKQTHTFAPAQIGGAAPAAAADGGGIAAGYLWAAGAALLLALGLLALDRRTGALRTA